MSSSLSQTGDRQVAESCLDFLLLEMVSLVASQIATSASESDKEAAYLKIESLGYRVGCVLIERYTKDRPRFIDNLDVVKYLCKDFWILLFKKQVDNLKTNHRGVYVLSDNSFRFFTHMSSNVPISNATQATQLPQQPTPPITPLPVEMTLSDIKAFLYPAFPCGILRGALANLGVSSSVAAEVTSGSGCAFQIKIRP